MKGKRGFGKYIDNGETTSGHDFMAIELLGPSLMKLFDANNLSFSLQTVAMIGMQLLNRLKTLHQANRIHADLKPENVTKGLGQNRGELYLIDFGLSQKINYATELNEPIKIDRFIGTFKYASIGAHKGVVSFRNDIESLAYMLLFFVTGDVPWNFNAVKDVSDPGLLQITICELKESFLNALPQNLPVIILKFFEAVKNMSYTQRPDYQMLRQTLE